MPERVKRTYRSPLRRSQAQETRRRVLDSAERLFEESGYGAVSIAQVADAAEVAPETVYAHFTSKRNLVRQIAARAVRGADDRPVLEQAGPGAVAAAADQRKQLSLFVADIVPRLERVAPLMTVINEAAKAEGELADLAGSLHEGRLENLRTLVDALGRNGPLRLEPADAADTVWVIVSPEVHQLLRRGRGWSQRRYSEWVYERLVTLLLVT
jgi:AcrR family transcriptional regulator